MNTVVTSKDEILKTNRELIQKQGWSAVKHPTRCGGLRSICGFHLQLF